MVPMFFVRINYTLRNTFHNETYHQKNINQDWLYRLDLLKINLKKQFLHEQICCATNILKSLAGSPPACLINPLVAMALNQLRSPYNLRLQSKIQHSFNPSLSLLLQTQGFSSQVNRHFPHTGFLSI